MAGHGNGVARDAGDMAVALAGPNIIQQALDLGLVDELTIDLAPVLLGSGIRFFEERDKPPLSLRRRLGSTAKVATAWPNPLARSNKRVYASIRTTSPTTRTQVESSLPCATLDSKSDCPIEATPTRSRAGTVLAPLST
jgi:hypothetical protein